MKIYVAGKFEEKSKVREVQNLLRGMGHSITYDWTIHEDSTLSGKELDDYLRWSAHVDIKGVFDCDAFVLLGHPNCKGALVEFGVALALCKPVVVLDSELITNVFLWSPYVYRIKSLNDLSESLTIACEARYA